MIPRKKQHYIVEVVVVKAKMLMLAGLAEQVTAVLMVLMVEALSHSAAHLTSPNKALEIIFLSAE